MQRRSSIRTRAGVAAGSALQAGSARSTEASVSLTSSPSPLDAARGDPEPVEGSNTQRPVSISNSTQPNAQMSARRSTGLPLACSGLM